MLTSWTIMSPSRSYFYFFYFCGTPSTWLTLMPKYLKFITVVPNSKSFKYKVSKTGAMMLN